MEIENFYGNCQVILSVPQQQKFHLPLVFLHGAWGTGKQFHLMCEALNNQGFTTYQITPPLHTQEESELLKYSFNDYVNEVELTIEKIGSCIFIGHSMGGLIAQKVAEKQGSKIVKLVLIGSGPAPKGKIIWNIPFTIRLAIKGYLFNMLRKKSIRLKYTEQKNFLFNDFENSWRIMLPLFKS